VAARSLTFSPASGAITLTGGTISVTSISAQNNGTTIKSPISLSGLGTVAFSRNTNAAGTLTLSGPIGGALGLTFTTPDVSSGNNVQTIVLGAASDYDGATLITTGNPNNTMTVKAGVTNALPATTVLKLDGGDGSGGGRTVTFDLNGKNQTLAGLTSVTGRTLRIQRVFNSSGTATLTISNTASYTFSGNIDGSGLSLSKRGSGTQTLAAPNDYTGDTSINAGTLRLGDDNVLPSITSVNLAGGTLNLNGTTNTIQSLFISGGAISGGGRLKLVNGGSTGVYNVAGNRTVGCNLELGSGTNGVGNNLDFGAAAGTTLTVTGVISSAAGYGVDISASGSGTVVFAAANTYAGVTRVQAGTLRLGLANGIKSGNDLIVNSGQTFDLNGYAQTLDSLTGSGTVDNGGGALTVGVGGSSFTFDGAIIGTGSLTKAGGGELTLTGSNSFTGNVSFETAATLSNTPSVITIKHSQALGVGPKNVSITDLGRTLKLDGSGGNLTLSSNIDFSVSNHGGTGSGNVASAPIINVGGTNTVHGDFSLTSGAGGTMFQSDAGSLILAGGLSAITGSRTLEFTGGGRIEVRGVIANGATTNLPVTKTGSGVLVLSGANTYTGPTAVNNGTLLVNGAIGTGAVSVAAGGTLGGTGRIGGTVTSAGIVSPGNSAGRLILSRSYTQNAGGALRMEIGGLAAGTQYDQLVVSNTATLGGNLTVVLTNAFVPAPGNAFVILRAASLGGTTFATTNLPALGSNLWTVTYAGNTAVVVSVIAPPSGYDAFSNQHILALGPEGDDDGDGYANLLEYVTGASPTNADEVARVYPASTNGLFAVQFTRNTNATDVTLIVEGAASLASAAWTGIATNRLGSWGAATNWTEGATTNPVRATVWDPAATTNRFHRLRVTRP
jgi:autotransporter-associated beta strand protein